jgi:hypothetical protein
VKCRKKRNNYGEIEDKNEIITIENEKEKKIANIWATFQVWNLCFQKLASTINVPKMATQVRSMVVASKFCGRRDCTRATWSRSYRLQTIYFKSRCVFLNFLIYLDHTIIILTTRLVHFQTVASLVPKVLFRKYMFP